jgi:hypothetical protein
MYLFLDCCLGFNIKSFHSHWCIYVQHPVSRSDYDNVIGALPYLKVNRKAT